jgi:DNA-binding MarR family transcriptional regulator
LVVALSHESLTLEALAESVSLPKAEVEAELAGLERAGLIEQVPGEDGTLWHSRWPVWQTEEWERLEQAEREAASAEITWAIKEEVEEAIAAGTFDAHPERFLVRMPLWVDEEGWQELHDALQVTLEECFAVQQRIKQRLKERGDSREGFPVRVHLVSFEPAPPERSSEF